MLANAKFNWSRVLGALIIVFLFVWSFGFSVEAAVVTDEIELVTRSILLLDYSGSSKAVALQMLDNLDQSKYDEVMCFDARRMTSDLSYAGSGNSSICEAIDAAYAGGYTHIAVITDGQQWPPNYSSLNFKAYTNMTLEFILTEEKDEDAAALVEELMGRMSKSSIKLIEPDGDVENVLDEYEPPIYKVEVEIPEPDDTKADDTKPEPTPEPEPEIITVVTYVEPEHPCICLKCWLLISILSLVIAAIISALWDLIHEILMKSSTDRYTCGLMKKEHKLLLDVSGSMSAEMKRLVDVTRRAKSKKLYVFAEKVEYISTDDVENIDLGGTTFGVEALLRAKEDGVKKLILASDLFFNGKTLIADEFGGQYFDEIIVLAPQSYNMVMKKQLHHISKKVEVKPL